MRARFAVALLVFGMGLPASAQSPTYTIKFKSEVEVGKTVTVQKTETETGTNHTLNAAGKVVKETPLKNEKLNSAKTVLSRGIGNEWMISTDYVLAQAGSTDKLEKLSYEGRTVISQRKGGVTRFGVVGAPELDRKDLGDLIRRGNRLKAATDAEEDRLMLPTKAVAIGEEWTIDVKAFSESIASIEVDLKASKCTGKLLKVTKQGSSPIGVLEFQVKLVSTSILKGLTIIEPYTMDVTMTVETAIDGSSTLRSQTYAGTLKAKGTFVEDKETMTVVIDRVIRSEQRQSEERNPANKLEMPKVKLVGPGELWEQFVSQEGKFSASFPTTPEISTKKDKGDVTTNAAATMEKGNVYYLVSYTDYANPQALADPKLTLQGVAAKFKDGKIEDVELDGKPGISIVQPKVNGKVTMMLYLRVYISEGRLYQVLAVVADESKDQADPKKFLESFQFEKKK